LLWLFAASTEGKGASLSLDDGVGSYVRRLLIVVVRFALAADAVVVIFALHQAT